MGSLKIPLNRAVKQMTAAEMKELVSNAVREALRDELTAVHVDSRGYLIFPTEAAYAAFLDTQPDKLPSEVKAYFLNPDGLRVHYSDYELIPKKARELDARKQEPTVSAETVWARLRELGVE